jgi:hypothetical protein
VWNFRLVGCSPRCKASVVRKNLAHKFQALVTQDVVVVDQHGGEDPPSEQSLLPDGTITKSAVANVRGEYRCSGALHAVRADELVVRPSDDASDIGESTTAE